MAVTLLNSSGYVWGIPSDEVGIKAASFVIRAEPEFREPRLGLQNAIEGWAIGPMQRILSITGEINNTTGVMAATSVVAFVPVNTDDYFGATTGGYYLTDGEVTLGRGEWKNVSANFQCNEGVT